MEDTYFVNRHGAKVWLSCGVTPRIDDFIIEVRPMLIADPGKVLVKGDEIIGKAIWSRTGIEGFSEIDEPIEEEPEDGESPETEEEPIEEEPEGVDESEGWSIN